MYGSIAKIYIFFTLCHDFKMFSFFRKNQQIYLDHAAATPLHPLVKKAMSPFLDNEYANPSAIHSAGLRSKVATASARQKVATVLGIQPTGITFTSGGTESNNLAILGLVKKLKQIDGIPYAEMEIVTTEIEHPSIANLIPILEATGIKVKFVEVDNEGKISVGALEAALSEKTVLVTFAYANSEVGTVQSVGRLVRVVRSFEKEVSKKIIVHVDAAQAPLWLPCSLSTLGVDLMSLDTGKCNGPKGMGILAKRGEVSLVPILYGGGQEMGLRPGTENVAGIVGGATALELAQKNYLSRAEKVANVRNFFFEKIPDVLAQVKINGPLGEDRLANNINISLPGFDTEYLVVYLDKHGIAASTKSACAGAGSGESKVVRVMTDDIDRAKSTLRLSLGEETTKSDLDKVLVVLTKFHEKMSGLT